MGRVWPSLQAGSGDPRRGRLEAKDWVVARRGTEKDCRSTLNTRAVSRQPPVLTAVLGNLQ